MRSAVVYDITREAPPLEFFAVGALFMAIGTLLFRFERETASAWVGPPSEPRILRLEIARRT